jgi:hypothetical protein
MRTFSASRSARALALFAWLLLALFQPAASLADTAALSHHGMPAQMASMAGHGMHHDGDCCGKSIQSACHCDAMCGSALLPATPASHGLTLLAVIYESLPGDDAPTLDPTPPLRPPAV